MSQSTDFTGKIIGGLPEASAWRPMLALLRQLEGQWVTITVRARKKRRSLKQNAYYFGVIVPLCGEFMRGYGNRMDDDEVHEWLKEHVGKLTKYVTSPSGVRTKIVRSSRELDTGEWEDYMQDIRAWAADFDLHIPLPNEPMQPAYPHLKSTNIEGEYNVITQ